MRDDEILALFFERSENAIRATADRYRAYCYRIAFNILGNHEDAEECVNDTYMRAWAAIPPARPAKLSAFLGKITRNLALNRYEGYNAAKRGHGQVEIALSELGECMPGAAVASSRELEDAEIAQSINAFLAGLSKPHRVVFVRRYWYLCSMEEIAADCGMSISKAKSILFRARKKLKAKLEKEGISL